MMNTPKKQVLILFAHPALQRSRVNNILIKGLDAIEGVTFHDLYEHYPDMYIDVAAEQELLTRHDIIIMHHPFYWYSTPAILKEWQDLVLTHGWAYGHDGRALQNKLMFNTITTGGPEHAYSTDGYNHFTLRQLLAPIEQSARLCGVTYLPPFAVHGTHLMTPEAIASHKDDYHTLLRAFTQDNIDLEKAKQQERLNSDLNLILKDLNDVR